MIDNLINVGVASIAGSPSSTATDTDGRYVRRLSDPSSCWSRSRPRRR
ncbi:hypothetical protein HBB16_18335 [Pseudonocardia sp. MCCB 268]|nr:hypothetical protein [Pseudonocardia cytotoxica]